MQHQHAPTKTLFKKASTRIEYPLEPKDKDVSRESEAVSDVVVSIPQRGSDVGSIRRPAVNRAKSNVNHEAPEQ